MAEISIETFDINKLNETVKTARNPFTLTPKADISPVKLGTSKLINEQVGLQTEQVYKNLDVIEKANEKKENTSTMRSVAASLKIAELQNDLSYNSLGLLDTQPGSPEWIRIVDQNRFIEQKMEAERGYITEDNFMQYALNTTAGLLPFMKETMGTGLKGGLATAMGAGTTSLLTGPAAPLTVPVATATGLAVGTTVLSAYQGNKLMTGQMLWELLNIEDEHGNMLNPTLAAFTAKGVAAVNTLFETMGIGLLLKFMPGSRQLIQKITGEATRKVLNSGVIKTIVNEYTKKYPIFVVGETGVELAQHIVETTGTELIKAYSNEMERTGFDHITIAEFAEESWEVVKRSATGMATIGFLPSGVNAAIDYKSRIQKKNPEGAKVLPENKDSNEAKEFIKAYLGLKNTYLGDRDVRILENQIENINSDKELARIAGEILETPFLEFPDKVTSPEMAVQLGKEFTTSELYDIMTEAGIGSKSAYGKFFASGTKDKVSEKQGGLLASRHQGAREALETQYKYDTKATSIDKTKFRGWLKDRLDLEEVIPSQTVNKVLKMLGKQAKEKAFKNPRFLRTIATAIKKLPIGELQALKELTLEEIPGIYGRSERLPGALESKVILESSFDSIYSPIRQIIDTVVHEFVHNKQNLSRFKKQRITERDLIDEIVHSLDDKQGGTAFLEKQARAVAREVSNAIMKLGKKEQLTQEHYNDMYTSASEKAIVSKIGAKKYFKEYEKVRIKEQGKSKLPIKIMSKRKLSLKKVLEAARRVPLTELLFRFKNPPSNLQQGAQKVFKANIGEILLHTFAQELGYANYEVYRHERNLGNYELKNQFNFWLIKKQEEARLAEEREEIRAQELAKHNKYKKAKKAEIKKLNDAIQLYIDNKQDPEQVKKIYDSGRLTREQMDLIDASNNLTFNQKAFANKISKIYEDLGNLAMEDGLIRNILDNYASRQWNMGIPKAAEIYSSFYSATKHAHKRSFKTIVEGWSKGAELKVSGATENLALYKDTIIKTLAHRKFFNALSKVRVPMGYTSKGHLRQIKLLQPFKRKGFEAVDVGNMKIYAPLDIAEPGAKKIISEDGTTLYETTIYAPKAVAKDLGKIFGKSTLIGRTGVDTLTKYNTQLKAITLALSAYHGVAFTRSYYLGAAVNWQNMNIIKAYKDGQQLIKNMDETFKLGVKNGLTIGLMQDWQTQYMRKSNIFSKMADRFATTKWVKDQMVSLNDKWLGFLFSSFGAGLKAKAFVLEFNKAKLKNPNLKDDIIAQEVATLINEDFGGLHLERISRDPTLQHIFHLAGLAPDWTESNFRTVSGMFRRTEKINTVNPKLARQLHREFWVRVVMRGMIVTTFMNVAIAYSMGGVEGLGERWESFEDLVDATWKDWQKFLRHIGKGDIKRGYKDFTNLKDRAYDTFRDISSVNITPIYKAFGAKGKEQKYVSLFGHFVDPVKFMATPQQVLRHKMSVTGSMGLSFLFREDWAGRRYTNLGELMTTGQLVTRKKSYKHGEWDFWYLSFLLSQIIGNSPVGVNNIISSLSGETDYVDGALSTFGMRVKTKRR